MKPSSAASLIAALSLLPCHASMAQTPTAAARAEVPDWALPGSETHKQVPPPADFHRASIHDRTPIGIFAAKSDIGAALVPGSSNYLNGTYTIHSAGYNIWYTRDEFHFLWKEMKGDVSLAADIGFPDPDGYGDRKAVLVIRQDLEDDSKQVVVALHGLGMIQLAQRPEKGALTRDREFRVGGRGRPAGKSPDSLVNDIARRIGIEKRGNRFALYVSLEGEPMTQYGPPIELEFTEPFYVGIGFCSHLPDIVDKATFNNVVLANRAGKVR
ncbi:MAG TPA: hypothetical protein VFL16_12785 [Steroidobacteraceae bacterium]|jgi:hypothetical protein|nr:hypothetical protein [Steroidobacteraceae bacterium]